MTWKLRWISLFVSLVLALSTAQPPATWNLAESNEWNGSWSAEVFADDDDDDDWDDDDWDDDDWDDDDWDDDDCDDEDDWDDDDCYVHDRTFDTALPNQAILQLNPGVDPFQFAADHDAKILESVDEVNLILLQLDPDMEDQVQVDELTTDERVTWAELNYTSHAPEGRPRYFFTSSALTSGFVDAPALPLELGFTSQAACVDGTGLIVAVLDTGVDVTHPMLKNNIAAGGVNTLDGTDDVVDDGNGIDDDADGLIDELVGHGTHVAGGIVQVAPDTQILPFKVLNSDGVGTTFSVASAIYLAVESDANVINLSLGSTYDSLAIRMAVEHATQNDVFVVAAAGNSNQYTPVEYPAAMESVISVASVNSLGDKSTYSNFHETVSISAPGESVASAYPGGQYLTASGTSMAAPMVSGTLVLLMERYPDTTTDFLTQTLHEQTTPLNLTDPLLEGLMGSGSLNIDFAIDCDLTGDTSGGQASVVEAASVTNRPL